VTLPPQSMSPKEQDKAKSIAAAAIEKRRRLGTWGGTIKAHTAYQRRPVEWITTYLEVPIETLRWSLNPEYKDHKWDGDEDPLVQILEALANWEDVGVESATGTGKTFLAACITLWFLACHQDALVAQWAPKEDQLLLFMWKEIGRLFPKFKKHFPTAEMYTGLLRMLPADDTGKETWAAKAFVAGVKADEESATKAQGFHGVHTLHITEETPGIPNPIMVAIKETRTADHNLHLALGNPDHRHDPLHQFCIRPRVRHVRISAYDYPNVVTGKPIVPGAIDKRRLEERIEDLGKGSRLYQSRIRGISPSQAEDALIHHEWCLIAAKKYDLEEYRVGVAGLGVDVANSEGGDKGAIARWQGSCLTEVEDFACPDSNLLGKRVADEIEDEGIDSRYVAVDPVGVGAGTVNELKRRGIKVREVGGANKTIPGLDKDVLWSETEPDLEGNMRGSGPVVIEAERFDCLRSQMWWRMREDLRNGRIALPNDEELFSDLTLVTFTTRGGKIVVQSKEDLFKSLRRSPNKGDAAVYGNWVRRRIPVKSKVARPLESTTNKDRGLERFFDRQKKRDAREERQLQRRLKKKGRSMRRQ
jgi:hypothetical protein